MGSLIANAIVSSKKTDFQHFDIKISEFSVESNNFWKFVSKI